MLRHPICVPVSSIESSQDLITADWVAMKRWRLLGALVITRRCFSLSLLCKSSLAAGCAKFNIIILALEEFEKEASSDFFTKTATASAVESLSETTSKLTATSSSSCSSAKHSQSFATAAAVATQSAASLSTSSTSLMTTMQQQQQWGSKSLNLTEVNRSSRKQETTLQESEFERYYNGQADGINYEAAYEQLQHSDRDVTTTEGEEDDEDAEAASYRKVPIKDLINSFENQSRPVMRYKLADEQIIRKVYNREQQQQQQPPPPQRKSSKGNCQETIIEVEEVEQQQQEQQQQFEEIHRNSDGEAPAAATAKEENYDSDACQGIQAVTTIHLHTAHHNRTQIHTLAAVH